MKTARKGVASVTTWHLRVVAVFVPCCVLLWGLPEAVAEDIPIPERVRTLGPVERQRIRYKNASLLEDAHRAAAEGKYGQALRDFRGAAQNDPGNDHIRVFLVRTLDHLGKTSEALAICTELLERYPQYADLHLSRAYMLQRMWKYDEASQAFENAIKELPDGDPRRVDLVRELAAALVAAGRTDDAIARYEDLLSDEFDPAAALHYHYLLKASGTGGKSEQLLKRVLSTDRLSTTLLIEATYELALVHQAAGRNQDYVKCMESLVEKAPNWRFLQEFAAGLAALDRVPASLEAYERSLAFAPGPAEKHRTCMSAAALCMSRNEPVKAKQWLEKASGTEPPDDNWQFRMAQAEQAAGEYGAAIDSLLAQSTLDRQSQFLLSFCWSRVNQPGLALYHLNKVADLETLGLADRYTLYSNRGYLYFEHGCYNAAYRDFGAALALRESDTLELARAKSLLLLGRIQEAERAALPLVERLDGQPELKAQALEVLGECSLAVNDYSNAANQFEQSMAADANALHLLYRRAIARYKDGHINEAEQDMLRHIEEELPVSGVMWGDYAFVEGQLKKYDEGIRAASNATAIYRCDISAFQEMAYQQMKDCRNTDARESFASAIDLYTATLPYLKGDDAAKYAQEQRDARLEYSRLDKTWGAEVYMTRIDIEEPIASVAETAAPVLVPQVGAIVTCRPPTVGFRNGKEFDVFVRALANLEDNSFGFDKETLQGGLGIAWKPFASVNYRTSLEKLFKIGDNSEDNWLWRHMASIDYGETRPKDENVWLFARGYGEAGFYLDDTRRWIYYFEGRIGPSFAAVDNVVLTVPRLIGIKRWQSNDQDGIGTYDMLGVGANLRIREGEKRYVAERWYLDIFAQYVYGWFRETPEGHDKDSFEGWMFGIDFVK
ncbi:MAG: tetratricopeptide repeat protein [Lentisphaerales bacterium]|nr:MAG: tetratricopeptide repeat protein [Lentisphaerales bacterium]